MRAKSLRKLRVVPPEGVLLLSLARTPENTLPPENLRGKLDWNFLLDLAHRHGLSPLVWWKLRGMAAGLVPEPVREVLRDRFLQASARHQILTRQLLEILASFAGRGVRAIPLKGPALAARLYSGLPLRESTDLDILVAPGEFPEAKKLLEDLGYARAANLTEREAAAHLPLAGEVAFTRAGGAPVDLHVRLGPHWLPAPFSHDYLWRRRIAVPLGSTQVPGLRDEDLLLCLCYHGGKSLWSGLKWVCDIDRLVRAGSVDWKETERRAAACGCGRMLRLALLLAGENLGTAIPPDVAVEGAAVRSLARQAADRWFSSEAPRGFEEMLFRLRLPDLFQHRLAGLAALLLTPSAADWRWVALPRRLSLLYWLLRPVRIGSKYAVGRWLGKERAPERPRPPAGEAPKISADSVIARTGRFSSCRVDGIFLIVNLAEARTFVLDAAAGQVWEHLAQPSRVSTLCELVSARRSALETIRFLTQLARERAIEVVRVY